jgi:hypothetical protein
MMGVLAIVGVLAGAASASSVTWSFEEGNNGTGGLGVAPTTGGWVVATPAGGVNGTASSSSAVSYVAATADVPGNVALQLQGYGDPSGWAASYVMFENNAVFNLSENRSYTIELFVKSAGPNADGDSTNWILSKDYSNSGSKGWGVYWNESTGKVSATFAGNTITSTTSIGDGAWHHLAITHEADSGTYTLYVDKSVEGTLENYFAGCVSAGNLYLGAGFGWQTPRTFAGWVDEFRISEAALSPSQFVPEPVTLAMLALGGVAVLRRRMA